MATETVPAAKKAPNNAVATARARGKLLAVKRASGKPACLRLPFIVGSRTESDTLFWNVPATGGYQGGYATGDYMAITLLKRFRSDECSLAGHA